MSYDRTKLLNKAKIGILSQANSVFLSTIIFSLKQTWSDKYPTAATDGLNLYINEEWFCTKMNDQERIGLLAHEGWHVAFNHVLRTGGRDHHKFNIAADYVINIMLEDHGYKLPAGGLSDEKFRGMSTEQVYGLLPDDPDDPMNGGGGFEPDVIPNDGSQQEQADRNAAVQDTLIKASQQSKMQGDKVGTIPGEIERLMDELLNPKLNWRTLLQNYMSEYSKEDYSWQRPNRRFQPDYYLPSQYSESLAEICIAVDTSGSVSDKEFLAFLTEINDIKTVMQPKLTTIIDFDSSIKKVHKLTADQSVMSVSFSGYGGTNLKPVFNYYGKDAAKPTVLIVFSDLECSEITEDPGYPVIWVCVNNPRANVNFGNKIDYDTSDL